jgi:hypothetical protein
MVVAVPLPAEVATRFPGLAVVSRTSTVMVIRSNRSPYLGLLLRSLGWVRLDTELSAARTDIDVMAFPNQDPIAALELLNPSFMDALITQGSSSSENTEPVGFVICQGWLAVAFDTETDQIDVTAHDVDTCPLRPYLESAMRIHKRVLAEYM